jgi:hypothetical protein
MWGVVSFTPLLLYSLEKDHPVPIKQGTEWTPESVGMVWRREKACVIRF